MTTAPTLFSEWENLSSTYLPSLSSLGWTTVIFLLVALAATWALFALRCVLYKKRSPKSAAFEIHMEFGPQSRIPRPKRLAAIFPHLSEEEISSWVSDFEQLEVEMWRLAEQGASSGLKHEEMAKRLTAKFPFLEPRAIRAAISRADYYAWHDGFLKDS